SGDGASRRSPTPAAGSNRWLRYRGGLFAPSTSIRWPRASGSLTSVALWTAILDAVLVGRPGIAALEDGEGDRGPRVADVDLVEDVAGPGREVHPHPAPGQ